MVWKYTIIYPDTGDCIEGASLGISEGTGYIVKETGSISTESGG